MATNSKDKKTVTSKEVEPKEVETKTDAKAEVQVNSTSTVPSTEDLLKIIAGLQEQLSSLTNKVNEQGVESVNKETNAVVQNVTTKDESYERTDKLLEILANRKQDKEVVIVHNREIVGGGSTAIKLTGLVINFHRLGEERVLNWQQFEECVSKYRRFFDI